MNSLEAYINNKTVVRNITFSGLLIALSIVLTRFFVIPYGMPSLFRLSLGTVPIITASLLMGPLFGGLVGALSDLIGATIFPVGTLIPWPIISSTLYGVLPWVILMLLKKVTIKTKLPLVYPFLGALLTILITYVFVNNNVRHPFNKNLPPIEFTSTFRVWFTIISVLVIFGLGVALYFVDKKLQNRAIGTIIEKPMQLVLTILIMEILVDIGYSSLWKELVFGVNFFVGIFFHTIVLVILLPVKTFIITLILSADKYSGHVRK